MEFELVGFQVDVKFHLGTIVCYYIFLLVWFVFRVQSRFACVVYINVIVERGNGVSANDLRESWTICHCTWIFSTTTKKKSVTLTNGWHHRIDGRFFTLYLSLFATKTILKLNSIRIEEQIRHAVFIETIKNTHNVFFHKYLRLALHWFPRATVTYFRQI